LHPGASILTAVGRVADCVTEHWQIPAIPIPVDRRVARDRVNPLRKSLDIPKLVAASVRAQQRFLDEIFEFARVRQSRPPDGSDGAYLRYEALIKLRRHWEPVPPMRIYQTRGRPISYGESASRQKSADALLGTPQIEPP